MMGDVEILLLRECVENKSTRENIIKSGVRTYPVECEKIANIYDLKRVKDKYILKIRNYDENSYSKKKIKEEEVIFVRKVYLFLKLHTATTETIRYKNDANVITAGIYDDSKFPDEDIKLYQLAFDVLEKDLITTKNKHS